MWILSTTLLILLGVIGVALPQHFRYLKLRRERVEDRQPLLYSARVFHAVTYLRVTPDHELIEGLRGLRDVIESQGGGSVVYAGLAGVNMVRSKQIPNDWSALILAQYPSREAFDASTARSEYRELLASFEDTYTHGAIRRVGVNLMLPLGLLLLRIANILRRTPSAFPFEPAGEEINPGLKLKMKDLEQLDQYRRIRDDAIVIFNLIQPGNKEQRRADRSYSQKMLSAMAEGSYGPMHLAKAVTVEGDANFRQFIAVYYPGIDHMHAMIASTFMNRIAAGKQLGDSLAVATIPVLSRL